MRTMTTDVLDRFSPATREWFRGSFAAPTAAQAGRLGRHQRAATTPSSSPPPARARRWRRSSGRSTGSPPSRPPAETQQRCRVLYISPLKALAVDVERNLRSPLVGIGHAATRLGLERARRHASASGPATPRPTSGARSRGTPPDILITTPESLFLMLTSPGPRDAARRRDGDRRRGARGRRHQARRAPRAVASSGSTRCSSGPAQRIGLSATVRPVDEVARFLAGGAPGHRRAARRRPRSSTSRSSCPVADMPTLGERHRRPERAGRRAPSAGPRSGRTSRSASSTSIAAHRSTIVFANSRRLAERLTARLNEIWEERRRGRATRPASDERRTPAAACAGRTRRSDGPAGRAAAPRRCWPAPTTARCQQGAARPDRGGPQGGPAAGGRRDSARSSSASTWVRSTWSIQVESPPSVASGLQRVGRAGHQVGAVSRGVIFPKFRGDLVQTAVVVERMRAGAIEAMRVPAQPARRARAADRRDVRRGRVGRRRAVERWCAARRRSPGCRARSSSRCSTCSSGRYPSDEFAELRPRLVWDRVAGTLTGRPGAQRLAVTSGGTIPDRGLFGVFLATGEGCGRAGRRARRGDGLRVARR